MAASLVQKYGLVPKFAYPESHTSQSTGKMNDVLGQLIVFSAHTIRTMLENGASKQQVLEYKAGRLEAVFRVLCIHLGTPPTSFDWQWRDKNGNFQRMGQTMTPLQFAKFVMDDDNKDASILDLYVCLVHDPRHPYYQNYTSQFAQTVVGGAYSVQFLNVPIDEMKSINQQMLTDGSAVWFACNVGQQFAEKPGLWDRNLYSLDSLYGVELGQLSKEDRIRLGYPMGTHAMLMTGVDIMDGKPRRWKVENSWGTDGGHDGYYTMNDNWYDEYVFEIVCPISYLTDQMKAGLATEPIVLPAWDPICKSSARARR
jgi:bleomycin hydrolase